LTKEEIRLQYSGFVFFAARMVSVATGMIFTLLLTRSTEQPEFGVWSNMFDLITYFSFMATAIPFWTTRFVARGKEGATKTALFANLILAVISVAIYVLLVPLYFSLLGISSSYLIVYLVASLYIAEFYMTQVLEAALRAKKPQAVGYGLLLEEIFKVILAYVLIIQFQQPFLGAITAIIIGFSVQVVYYLKLASGDLNQKVQWNYVREWLKGSIANIYNLVGNQIAAFILILLFTYAEVSRADYGAAVTIANVVAYSSSLSFALYPKMLAEKSTKDVATAMKMVLMFAIPMAAGAIAIPDSFLVILGEEYREAVPILVLLAMDALVATLSLFYLNVLFGVEKLDEEAKIPLKKLARSNIFKAFTLPYIHSLITLPTAFYVLTNFAAGQPVQAAVYVTAINMAARLAMFLVLYVIVRKAVSVAVPWRSISKYILAAAVMGILLYILPHPARILTTLGMAAAGGILYLGLLIVMDRESSELISAMVQEIRNIIGKII
jgi:O-antigen/teichoic acid export membrane protein